MRSHTVLEDAEPADMQLANIASKYSDIGQDAYSDIGIGAALLVKMKSEDVCKHHIYAGTNINLSGMQTKIHAEQLALYDLIADSGLNNLAPFIDIEAMVVHSTRDNLELCCGHCLQITRSVCQHFETHPETVDYCAVAGQELYDDSGNPEGVNWRWDRYTLDELLGSTYAEK